MVFVGSESERMEDVYRYTSFELSRSMHVVRVRTVCNTTSILFKTECIIKSSKKLILQLGTLDQELTNTFQVEFLV